ncbi:MAG TPA: hypothetical protein VFL34_10235 [Candidatus Sulfotelmatobacter sp.]|nr:hypothetical protein [Candidatus Sulfotelmatobacter sp.]
MFGRNSSCLLISILLLTPIWLRAQSGHPITMPDFTLRHSPRVVQPPIDDPLVREPVSVAPQRAANDLTTLVRAAGSIFSGTVTAIVRHPATSGQTLETVAITFHVENAIRGATPGEFLTISQWIGLWSGGQRYRLGERVLLFLYSPSKLGLTSCVAGGMGRLPIDAWGRVLLSAQHLAAFRADPVLGGKSRLRFSDFALAVRRASEEE